MSSSQSSGPQGGDNDLVRAARPLTDLEAARAEDEAHHRAVVGGEEVMGERRRARVEAEAHRVSEEMTRRAQERQRALEQAHTDPQVPEPAPEPVQQPAPDPGPPPLRSVSLPSVLPQATAIKRVMVPLSGAAFAERAVPYGVALARLTGASMMLVHVGEPPLSEPMAALERAVATLNLHTQPTATPLASDQSPHFGSLWEQVVPHLAGVEWLNLPDGRVAESLLTLEAPDGSDLAVLATRRHIGTEGNALGTVARALVRHGRAPVLVIPPDAVVPEQGLPGFSRILVPLDGSLLAEQALAPVMALASMSPVEAWGAGEGVREIVLFSVAEAQPAMDDAYPYLNDLCRTLQTRVPETVHISVDVHLGSAPGAIVAMAERGGGGEAAREHPVPFDLVALATHGRGGMRRWLLGSVAEYVLTHATVPVLVLRSAQDED